jgi:hypothetical protein
MKRFVKGQVGEHGDADNVAPGGTLLEVALTRAEPGRRAQSPPDLDSPSCR